MQIGLQKGERSQAHLLSSKLIFKTFYTVPGLFFTSYPGYHLKLILDIIAKVLGFIGCNSS